MTVQQPVSRNQPQRRTLITVNVRKGANDNERRLWFACPSNVPTEPLMRTGFAFDGNQMQGTVAQVARIVEGDTRLVTQYVGPFGVCEETLSQALGMVQLAFVDFMLQRGYDVYFS